VSEGQKMNCKGLKSFLAPQNGLSHVLYLISIMVIDIEEQKR